MFINDAIILDKKEITEEGYLQCSAKISRTGIYTYLGYELGDFDNPEKIFKVFRSEAEVFDSNSMQSFANKPVTDNHPQLGFVDVGNYQEIAKGFSMSEIKKDSRYLIADLLITDKDLIEKIKLGKVEVSNGYNCDLVKENGTSFDGQEYQYVQKNIQGNHIAVVDMGRAGAE